MTPDRPPADRRARGEAVDRGAAPSDIARLLARVGRTPPAAVGVGGAPVGDETGPEGDHGDTAPPGDVTSAGGRRDAGVLGDETGRSTPAAGTGDTRRRRGAAIDGGRAGTDVATLLARVGMDRGPLPRPVRAGEGPRSADSAARQPESRAETAAPGDPGFGVSRADGPADDVRVVPTSAEPPAADTEPRDPGSPRHADPAALAARIATVAQRFAATPVDVDTDFFDAGGTSVAAVEWVAALATDLDILFDLDTVFFDARPRRLAARWLADHPAYVPPPTRSTSTDRPVGGGRSGENSENFRDTDDLALLFADLAGADRLPIVAPAPREVPRRILLTGATGFLGSHLLLDLLRHSDAHVVCLVRAEDDAAAARRLEEALRGYALPWSREVLRRVTPLAGDLREPRLGVTAARWETLAAEVDAIVNAGAAVDFLRGYPSLRRTNVLGTLTLAELACATRPKPIHHVSSLAVFNGTAAATLAEDAPPANVAALPIGYDRSKWAGEAVLRRAAEHGVTVTVLRPGGIGGRPETGAHNSRDLGTGITAALLRFRTVPGFRYLNAAPVDWVSRVAAGIVLEPDAWGQTYHLTGPPTTLDRIVAETAVGGMGVRVRHWEEWCEEVIRAIRTAPAPELEPLAQVLGSPVARRQLAAMVDIAPADARRTEAFAAAHGIPAPSDAGPARAAMLAVAPQAGEHPYLRFRETLAGTLARGGTEFPCELRLTLSVATSARIFTARTLEVGGELTCPALADRPLTVAGTAAVRPHDGTPLPGDLRHPIMVYHLTLRDDDGGSWWFTGYKFAAARRRFVRQLGTQVVEIGRTGAPAELTGEVSVPPHTYLPDQIDGIEIDPDLPERQRRLAKMLWLSWFGGQLGKSLMEPMLRAGLDLLDLRRALRKERR
ncbi:thioester reductase domain-containing protein [Nocardia thailandica]